MATAPHIIFPTALTALTEAAAAINSTLEPQTVLRTIARYACAVTRAEACGVFALDGDRGKLVLESTMGRLRDLVGRSFDAHAGVVGRVVRTGEPMVVPDVSVNKHFARDIDGLSNMRTRTVMAVPLLYRGAALGAMEVANRLDEQSFSDSDVKILQVFATIATSALQNARVHEELRERFVGLRESVAKESTIIGHSPQLQQVLDLCQRVAPSNATVLLLGETGTGKELTARYLHNRSQRRGETFVAVNCAALPENLLESELFGHEKGSFTGALAQRRGWFELAGNGTLFLDEIGDISRSTQAKLLRALQEREVVRVGGTKPISVDARVIAATNRNLKNMMIDGLFREDLYYRLSVFPIQLPPLRERRDDIPRLVEHVMQRCKRELHVPELTISPKAIDVLKQYPWPGNIRELQNVVERAVLMCDGPVLLPCNLPPEVEAAGVDEPPMDTSTLMGQECSLILDALRKHDWNQSSAARSLGISRYHLRHRIKKYGIQRPASETTGA